MYKNDSDKPNSKIELVCQNLDKEIDTLCEHIKEQEKIANKFQIEAKTFLKNKDKKGALQALIEKKRCVKQIYYFEESLDLLKQQKMILENLMMKKQIFKQVKETNETIKEAHEVMKIKDFEKLIEDLKNFVNEISESIQNLVELEQENKIKKVEDENLNMKNKILKTIKETNEAIKEAYEAMKNKDFENIFEEFTKLKNFVNEISESNQNQNEDALNKVEDNLEQNNKIKEVDLTLVCQNLDKEIDTLNI